MSENDLLFSRLQEGRDQFLALVKDVRPDLHRYCARMTGSIADGEDVVQDTLARAYYEMAELKELPAMRSWLFRIAHNRALDYLRRNKLRLSEPLDVAMEVAADDALDPDNALAREQAVRAAVTRFVELVPAQRSCVILKDVLDYSLGDIATLLDMSVPAVKSVLHRGRSRLREISTEHSSTAAARYISPVAARYAALFNARDWDGVRKLLIDDVRLDLVSRLKAAGREQVGNYFSNYDKRSDWYLVPGWLDGREVIAVLRDPHDAKPAYFIELTTVDDRVAKIHDFRYVPYIAQEANITLALP
jgi:RNA polymerase sigma-70 factor (ECF subfamily)